MDNELFQELIQGKRDSYVMERRYHRRDGRIIWARVNYSLVRDPEGKPSYLIGMIEDIDEQKRAAERMSAQEAEYRQTLENKVSERTQELLQINQRLEEEIAQRQKAEQALAEKLLKMRLPMRGRAWHATCTMPSRKRFSPPA